MDLWNEYEGRTIAGRFPLERLLRPEGRSAFFSTSTGNGTQTVIRLIESHYDDEEILARWDAVAGLNQPHLLSLKKFGQFTMDDTALVYAVMEPSEADLGQILSERTLTQFETRELTLSLVAALEALHSIAFVHEHIQPINILAVGDTIKLRSDCVREVPEGVEGDKLRARDVHDLALVLLLALTLGRDPDVPIPSPFEEIIRNGLSGRWGLEEIAYQLAAPMSGPAYSSATQVATDAVAAVSSSVHGDNGYAAPQTPIARPAIPQAEPEPVRYIPTRTPPERTYFPVDDVVSTSRLPLAAWAVIAVIIIGVFLWNLLPRRTAHPAASEVTQVESAQVQTTQPEQPKPTAEMSVQSAQSPVAAPPAPQTTPQAAPVTPAQAQTIPAQPAPTVPAPAPATVATPVAGTPLWRVVTYTYNHEGQAQAKADHLNHEHHDLHFEVFSPKGREPYLVIVNGAMSRDQALALQSKLRGRHGLPGDIFARNYPAGR